MISVWGSTVYRSIGCFRREVNIFQYGYYCMSVYRVFQEGKTMISVWGSTVYRSIGCFRRRSECFSVWGITVYRFTGCFRKESR